MQLEGFLKPCQKGTNHWVPVLYNKSIKGGVFNWNNNNCNI